MDLLFFNYKALDDMGLSATFPHRPDALVMGEESGPCRLEGLISCLSHLAPPDHLQPPHAHSMMVGDIGKLAPHPAASVRRVRSSVSSSGWGSLVLPWGSTGTWWDTKNTHYAI